MIRSIPDNATYNTTAEYVNGTSTWKLYIYKCNDGIYTVMGEIETHHEFYSFYSEPYEDPEEDDVTVELGVWNAGTNERDAIELLLKKVNELETFLNETFDVTFK